MRRILTALPAAALFAALSVSGASAAPWALDKSHSLVSFTVNHFGFSDTLGVFRTLDAQVDYDPEAPAEAKVSFEIDAASVDTFFAARDDHLRTADFFNVEKFPKITFISKSVETTGDDTAKVTGDLTLLGQTHEETFEVRILQLGPNPASQTETLGVEATGVIDRTKYGMSTYAPAIGAEIPVRVSLELTPGS
ncbi:YceI family protein [Neomegalonema sp.]|uniref:YceI family protein n=1 Tax=Neomegalonema sp. TaxID=2039713 RepID=UPI0026081567|nr:YceI family protein [Neomegalonema sp.]MDD2867495.1 YceI family protein [Neomegalonema sp.]